MKFYVEYINGDAQILTFPDGRPLVCPFQRKDKEKSFEREARRIKEQAEKTVLTKDYTTDEIRGRSDAQARASEAYESGKPLAGHQNNVAIADFDWKHEKIQFLIKVFRDKKQAPVFIPVPVQVPIAPVNNTVKAPAKVATPLQVVSTPVNPLNQANPAITANGSLVNNAISNNNAISKRNTEQQVVQTVVAIESNKQPLIKDSHIVMVGQESKEYKENITIAEKKPEVAPAIQLTVEKKPEIAPPIQHLISAALSELNQGTQANQTSNITGQTQASSPLLTSFKATSKQELSSNVGSNVKDKEDEGFDMLTDEEFAVKNSNSISKNS